MHPLEVLKKMRALIGTEEEYEQCRTRWAETAGRYLLPRLLQEVDLTYSLFTWYEDIKEVNTWQHASATYETLLQRLDDMEKRTRGAFSHTKPSTVLQKLQKRLALRACWIQGDFAQTITGEFLDGGDQPGAACWCMEGAIEAEKVGRLTAHAVRFYILTAAKELGHGDYEELPGWNDDEKRTHEQVLAALDKARQLAEEAGE